MSSENTALKLKHNQHLPNVALNSDVAAEFQWIPNLVPWLRDAGGEPHPGLSQREEVLWYYCYGLSAVFCWKTGLLVEHTQHSSSCV